VAVKKKVSKSLSEQAKENANVTRGTSKNQEVLKKGLPNDHSAKHFTSDAPVVGISIGSTINMENYESLRADVWLTDSVKENETIEQAYQRVTKIVDKTLQDIVNQYTE
jgi:hypothetical protein